MARQGTKTHRRETRPQCWLRGKIDQHRTKQGEPDTDTAQDKIFPRRLERRSRARQADSEGGGNRRPFHGGPEQADIIRVKPEQGGAEHHLAERVIKPPERRRQPRLRPAHVKNIGKRRGERDEAGQRAKQQPQRIGMNEPATRRREHRQRQQKHKETQNGIGNRPLQRPSPNGQRHSGENGQKDGEQNHHRPRLSIASIPVTSSVSKCSRMRSRKIPTTRNASSTSNATENSATKGMPGMPMAASTNPFSVERKPMICASAERRVTITSSPSSTTDRAMARSSRVSDTALIVLGSTTSTAMPINPTPRISDIAIGIALSTARTRLKRSTISRSPAGSNSPFSATVMMPVR